MRVEVTLRQVIEILPEEDGTEPSIDQVRDSFQDTYLDDQEAEHETSDSKVHYVPGPVIALTITEVAPGWEGTTRQIKEALDGTE